MTTKLFVSLPTKKADVLLCEDFFSEFSEELYNAIDEEVKWEVFNVNMMGKILPQPRLSCYMADEGMSYFYSGYRREPVHWTPVLKAVRDRLNIAIQELSPNHPEINAVLCNKYSDGNSYIGYHSDDTRDLYKDSYITSVSLGQKRNFLLQNKLNDDVLTVPLESGSVILMGKGCQEYYKHSIPKTKEKMEPRINLTFRCINRVSS